MIKYAMIVALIATTIAKSKICESLRIIVLRWRFLDQLIHCPYCLCFWIGLPTIYYMGFLDYLYLVSLACIGSGLLCLSITFMEEV